VSARAARNAADEAELRLIFRLVDQDHSGYIDAAELLALGKAINPKFTQQKCRALISKMDTSHDGQVSESEFVTLVSNFISPLPSVQREAGMKAMRVAARRVAHVLAKTPNSSEKRAQRSPSQLHRSKVSG
jgi:hypothetical protein